MVLVETFLRRTPHFRGKDRLSRALVGRRGGAIVEHTLRGGGRVLLDLSVPYEAAVWLDRDDRAELALLGRLLRPGDVFVDGGANIGVWSLVAGTVVGPSGCVHAFEPNPAVHEKLVGNVARNGLGDRIHAHRAALGAHDGQVRLSVPEQHDMSRVVEDDSSGLRVPVVTVDETVPRPARGMKLDLEGYELPALEGAARILREDRPWICVEFNTAIAGTQRLADWPVHERLRSLGYRPRLIGSRLGDQLPDAWSTTLGHCNLLYEVEPAFA